MVLVIKSTPLKETVVFNAKGEAVERIQLPSLFNVPVRKDLIRRAFHAEFTSSLQPKGRDPMAGKRTPAVSLGVGRGLARVPRVPGTSEGAFAPMTVGGRVAHPIKVTEKIIEEINKKEKILATASAIAATANLELIKKRGHVVKTQEVPIVIDEDAEKEFDKAILLRQYLQKLGLWEDIERASSGTGIRSGKGKMRGRKYVEPKSLLFVVSSLEAPIAKAARNFPGVDVKSAMNVSVMDLAPGGVPGRLTVYTKPAIQILEQRFKGKLVII